MPKQTELDLGTEKLAALWARIPEPHRREAVVTWARLIADAARAPTEPPGAPSHHAITAVNHESHHSATRPDEDVTGTDANQGVPR